MGLLLFFTVSNSDPVNFVNNHLVQKMDKSGNIIFSKEFGVATWSAPYTHLGRGIVESGDGGYIGISTTEALYTVDMSLVKFDSQGDTVWTKIFDDMPGNEMGANICITRDGGFAFVGGKGIWSSGEWLDQGIWVIKTNSSGDSLWSRILGEGSYYQGYSIYQTNDNGYIVAGTIGDSLSSTQASIYRLNTNGGIIWQKSFGDGRAFSVKETKWGNFIVGCTGALFMLDNNGVTNWSLPVDTGAVYSIEQTIDEGFLLGCTEKVMKIDAAGDVVWTHQFPEGEIRAAKPTPDGGFAIYRDKIDQERFQNATAWIETFIPKSTAFSDRSLASSVLHTTTIQLIPNPVRRYSPLTILFTTQAADKNISYRIWDIHGNIVSAKTLNSYSKLPLQQSGMQRIELENGLLPGYYILDINRGGNNINSAKFRIVE